MRIMLACAAGMSTSLLVTKMKKAMEEQGKSYEIWAVDVGSVEKECEKCDVILLGPQVRFQQKKIQERINHRVPVAPIDPMAYGRGEGAKVLAFAESLVEG